MSSCDLFPEKPRDDAFPLVFGNEQETGMQTDISGEMDEPYDLAQSLGIYTPSEITGNKQFLRNGYRLYAGGAAGTRSPTNIERATPECRTPQELVRYMRAGGHLVETVAKNYAVSVSKAAQPVEIRIQDRVVDSTGSRKACHDNFGISQRSVQELLDSANEVNPVVLEHLATRHFVTGAGYVRKHSLRYSQKVDRLTEVKGYGYFGSMYRVDGTNGTPRFEVRCSDVNISDWASWMRIGSTALALAVAQTPLAKELDVPFRHDDEVISDAKRYNALRLTPEGGLRQSEPQLLAVDYQQELAELAMDKLQLYIEELPIEFYEVARELYKFCEDYKKVLTGEATIALLADRADWAAKLQVILNNIERDEDFGISRRMGDIASRASDLRYDSTQIFAAGGEIQEVKRGIGHRLRARGFFSRTVKEEDVLAAYLRPPSDTRASLRGGLLKHFDVSGCDWHWVTIQDGEKSIKVDLKNVLQTQLPQTVIEEIEQVKRIR